MSTVPFIFAGNTGNIPLSQLDANFANAKSAADFVIANNQANITSVGTLTGLSVNGNILGNGVVSITGNTTIGNNLSVLGTITAAGNTIHGNIFTTGLITATGNITGGNILTGGNVLTAGLVSAAGNVTGNNILTDGLVSAAGNVTGNNILTDGLVSATGNIIASTLNAVNTNLTGNLIVEGNAQVNGTTTFINTQNLNITDKNITIANGVSTSALIDGAGIDAGNPTVAYIRYSNASQGWTTANNFSIGGNLAVTGVATATTVANSTANTQVATTAFVRNIIPTGVITLWYGSIANIPNGWYLCDGGNGTPDLRDRFVVGAGNIYAVAATGGSADAVVVQHNHTATSVVTDPGHEHLSNSIGLDNVTINFSGTGGLDYNTAGTQLTSSNVTGITVATTTANAGVSGTNANLPPYYSLAYIMKA
jgi:hypothetical protein